MNLSGLLNLNLSFAAYDFVELLAVILAQRKDDAAPILPDDCKDPHTAAIIRFFLGGRFFGLLKVKARSVSYLGAFSTPVSTSFSQQNPKYINATHPATHNILERLVRE